MTHVDSEAITLEYSASIISIVWSSGKAHASIHQVHEQILSLVADRDEIHNWMLMGRETGRILVAGTHGIGGRARKRSKAGVWRLPQWCLQRRLAREIERVKPKALLLDGIGVARLIIPVVARLKPEIQVVVVFHGQSRIRRSDPRLFSAIAVHRLKLVAVSVALAGYLGARLGER